MAAREPLFRAASHHYQVQRTIADCVPETTARLTPEAVAARLGHWRELVDLPVGAEPPLPMGWDPRPGFSAPGATGAWWRWRR